MAVVATVALAIGGIIAFSTDNTATPPATSKTLTDNGDGTYNLNLSVTGSASSSTTKTKANVVIVMDISGSMSEKAQSDTGYLGNTGRGYFQLYDSDGNAVSEGYAGSVYRYSYNYGWTQYTGTRYSTRLDIAKKATSDLVNTLASNNTSATDDTVEITFETFSNYTKIAVKPVLI